MKSDRIRQAINKAAEALERGREAREKLEKLEKDERPPACGDVYLPPVFSGWDAHEEGYPADLGLSVVVIRQHPDTDDLYLLAPVDSFPLHGLTDIAVKEKDREDITILCGRSFWAPITFLIQQRRYRVIDKFHMSRVKQLLHELATGKDFTAHASQEKWENEADPEYQHYLEEVGEVVLKWQQETEK